MSNPFHARAALGLALAALALAACERPAGDTAARTGDTVGQKVDRTLATTKEELAKAGEQVKPTLERAGESIERGAEKLKPTLERAGEKMKEAMTGDPAITASIKASYLKDPDLSVLKIDVDTKDGVVTLNGVAESPSAKMRAVKLAEATKGVKEVRDHLSVKQG